MNQLALLRPTALLALAAAAGDRASMRFLEFFAANIRNPHTRQAYYERPRTRTTQLYDRSRGKISLDDVERIVI